MTLLDPPAGPGSSRGRFIAAVSGATALLGFVTTLLPVLTVNAAAYSPVLDRLGYQAADDAGRIDLTFGYYDWISTSQPAVALIPIALALAATTGLLQALRTADRTAQAVTMFVALGALVVATLTAIRPAMSVDLTGHLGRQAGRADDIAVSASVLSVAPVVSVTAIALVVVVGLNAWQVLTGQPRHAVPSSR